jgi:hypothetical protein
VHLRRMQMQSKPTPQLPITAVVMPFCEDGVMS